MRHINTHIHGAQIGLPRYVGRGGEQVARPPSVCLHTQMYNFLVPADERALDLVLHRYLNEPSGGEVHYVSAAPYVLLYWAAIAQARSGDRRDSELGYFRELELGIWNLAYDVKNHKLTWFTPYIFTDTAQTTITGREVYGFPKQNGFFEIPERPDDRPWQATLDTLVTPSYGREQKARRERLITVRATGDAPASEPRSFHSGGHMLHSLGETLGLEDVDAHRHEQRTAGSHRHPRRGLRLHHDTPRNNVALNIAAELATGNSSLTLLKQFRDLEYPMAACYQAINEVTVEVTKLRTVENLSTDYEILIEPYASEPIHRELGLPFGALRPSAAVYVDIDLEVKLGHVVWRAPVEVPSRRWGWNP